MVKYSSFLLIASIWLYTVLCISAASVSANKGKDSEVKRVEDQIMEIFKSAFQQWADTSTSSYSVVKFIREEATEYTKSLDNDKKEIQDALTEGTELEKRIQSVLTSLKNSTKPLPNALQLEVDAIGNTVTVEIKKLKEMNKVEDINGIKKDIQQQYENIQRKTQELCKAAENVFAKNGDTFTITEDSIKKAKTELLSVVIAAIPLRVTTKKGSKTVSNKMRTTHNALSEIRNELNKLEQIQYNLLLSYKDQFTRGSDSSVRLSMVQFAIAIMFGILF